MYSQFFYKTKKKNESTLENLISFMYDLSDSLKLSSDTLIEVVNVHATVEMTHETDEDERWMTEEDNIPLSKLM